MPIPKNDIGFIRSIISGTTGGLWTRRYDPHKMLRPEVHAPSGMKSPKEIVRVAALATDADATFIAEAHDFLPRLLVEREELLELLRAFEDGVVQKAGYCIICRAEPHAAGCLLAAFLKET